MAGVFGHDFVNRHARTGEGTHRRHAMPHAPPRPGIHHEQHAFESTHCRLPVFALLPCCPVALLPCCPLALLPVRLSVYFRQILKKSRPYCRFDALNPRSPSPQTRASNDGSYANAIPLCAVRPNWYSSFIPIDDRSDGDAVDDCTNRHNPELSEMNMRSDTCFPIASCAPVEKMSVSC